MYEGLADYTQAIAHREQALGIYRDIGDPQMESYSLIHLGDAQLAAGLPAAARYNWEQALAVLSKVPGGDTREVSTRLAKLPVTNAAGIGAIV